MPVLPFLEDTPDGVRRLVRAAYNAGARFVDPAFGVTLRQNQRAYFLDRLDELFPGAGLRARYVRQLDVYKRQINARHAAGARQHGHGVRKLDLASRAGLRLLEDAVNLRCKQAASQDGEQAEFLSGRRLLDHVGDVVQVARKTVSSTHLAVYKRQQKHPPSGVQCHRVAVPPHVRFLHESCGAGRCV